MGLLSICPAGTFLEATDSACLQSRTQYLLSAFFEAMHTTTVYMRLAPGPVTKALQDFKGESPSRIGAECLKVLAEPVKHEAFPASVAARQGAIHMGQLPQPTGISTGISFGLDKKPVSPETRWSLMLHQGPLPFLELCLSDRRGFGPPPGWVEGLKSSGAVNILCSGKRYLGTAGDLYLWFKSSNIFPYSKGDSNTQALAAAQQLRRLCHEVVPRGRTETATTPIELAFWRWKQRRFIRKFDKALLNHVGADKLSAVLKTMGTSPEEWFGA